MLRLLTGRPRPRLHDLARELGVTDGHLNEVWKGRAALPRRARARLAGLAGELRARAARLQLLLEVPRKDGR